MSNLKKLRQLHDLAGASIHDGPPLGHKNDNPPAAENLNRTNRTYPPATAAPLRRRLHRTRSCAAALRSSSQ